MDLREYARSRTVQITTVRLRSSSGLFIFTGSASKLHKNCSFDSVRVYRRQMLKVWIERKVAVNTGFWFDLTPRTKQLERYNIF